MRTGTRMWKRMSPDGLTVRRLVPVRLFDGLLADIRPEYQPLLIQKVQRCCVIQITNDDGRLPSNATSINQTHITPVSKEQEGRS